MATTVVNKLPLSFFSFCFLSLTSLSLMIVALATKHWVTIDFDGGKIYLGLFQYCIEGNCENWDDSNLFTEFDYDVVKALCLIALVLSVGGACILIHFVNNKRDEVLSKNQGWLCFAVCLIGGLFAFSGVGNYNRMFRDDLDRVSSRFIYDFTYYFDYSYFLAWGSGVAAILSAISGICVVSHFFKLHMLRLATTQAMNTNAQPIVSVVGGNANPYVVPPPYQPPKPYQPPPTNPPPYQPPKPYQPPPTNPPPYQPPNPYVGTPIDYPENAPIITTK